MTIYMFRATIGTGSTPIFGAKFSSVEGANSFLRRIKNELSKQCPGVQTDFQRIKNTRSRQLPTKMQTFSKPKRMTVQSIRKMPGVPKKWRIKAKPKPERRVLARV